MLKQLNPETAYKIYCEQPEYTHNTKRAGAVAREAHDNAVRQIVENSMGAQTNPVNYKLVNVLFDRVFWQELKALAEKE